MTHKYPESYLVAVIAELLLLAGIIRNQGTDLRYMYMPHDDMQQLLADPGYILIDWQRIDRLATGTCPQNLQVELHQTRA